jgi:hypothetical protein
MVAVGGPAAAPTTYVDLLLEETRANLLAFAPLMEPV